MNGSYKKKLEGLQVVKVSEEPGRRYELDEKALESILLRDDIRNLPVVVVSVAGAFRGGKSFILDFFLRYLKAPRWSQLSNEWVGSEDEHLEGFDWRGGGESNTKGIHLWPEPIVVTIDQTGEKMAVLLMDTQGTFDMESDMGDNSTIFALATLLSSVQIYNLRGNIGEDDLQHLQLFTQYGKLACNAEGKAFQTLLFLIRDWSSPYEHPYGYTGGEGLMKKRFEPRLNQRKQLREVREHIHSCFETLKCFLMPHPGLKVTDIQFKGRLCDIDEKFRVSLLELIPSLFDHEHLTSKTINGNKVSTKGLLEFFKQYVDIFNSDELPEATTIYQATVDACMMTILRESREYYESKMDSNIIEDQSVTENTIQEWHNAAIAEAIALFERKKKLGTQDDIEARRSDLQKELEDRLNPYLWQNDTKLKDALSNAKKAFENIISDACKDQARLCLHVKDLYALYFEAVPIGLALFDCTRTAVPQELDEERKDLVKYFENLYEKMCAVNEQNNRSAILEAREIYLLRMNNGFMQQEFSSDELLRQHEEALNLATNHFHSLRNRPTQESEDAHLEQLLQSSAEHYKNLCSVYEHRKAALEDQELLKQAAREAHELHMSQLREITDRMSRIEAESRRHRNDCAIL
ncbi:unnamed protein product [Arctia plantaginis]|uniref:GB1/RHD3-type G domain-containing protein n=1 Tax=Arctia plantaginis TaxID=874455 RepID=A0A8S1A7E4_ARCPL|nr:unnamed protein product [Arctia plantaginis]